MAEWGALGYALGESFVNWGLPIAGSIAGGAVYGAASEKARRGADYVLGNTTYPRKFHYQTYRGPSYGPNIPRRRRRRRKPWKPLALYRRQQLRRQWFKKRGKRFMKKRRQK